MENMKYQICPYTMEICQEGHCVECQTYLNRWIWVRMKTEIARATRETDVRETVPEEFIRAFEGEV